MAVGEVWRMATVNAALVPLEEYLETVYRPDRDWIRGELRERNVGEKPHARIQRYLCFVFQSNQDAWRVEAFPEQKVQTSAEHYRIADVCVTVLDESDDVIVRTPPVLCVEILWRDDRMTDMQERVDDYFAMGMGTVWLIDPRRRKAFNADARGTTRLVSDVLEVPGTAIRVSVEAMFGALGS
jgi:Uma2 family endonuclease